jgi:hypothetical protein
MLTVVPIGLAEAHEFVRNFHRHNKPAQGGKFAIGCSDGDGLVGVIVIGRPVARSLDDGVTAEVTRGCVIDGARNANSLLYSAAWRACRAMGYRRLITYTLQTETGASLRGAGWKVCAECAPNDPARWQSRPGREWQPVVGQAKFRWEAPAKC